MEETVDFRKYPNLSLLLWDTQEKEMGAFDAFSLLDCRFSKYIRNDWLNDDERELLQRLAAKSGTDGSWSRDAPTADTPTRQKWRTPSGRRGWTHLNTKCSASLLCRRYWVKRALRSFSQLS